MKMEMIESSSGLRAVPFHDDTVFLVEHEEQPYVPVRPVVENLGLDWATQYRKLMAEKRRWSVVIMTTVATDGRRREMVSIPLRKFFGFLNSIEPSRVKPAIRPKLELYQEECDEVLWRYWSGELAKPRHETLAATEKRLRDLIYEEVTVAMRAFKKQLEAEYSLSRIPPPPVDRGEVLQMNHLVKQGYNTARIAEMVHRSPSTVRKHTAQSRALRRALNENPDQGTLFN